MFKLFIFKRVKNMKVAVYTLGCKVNTYESEYAINEFKKRGYEITDFSDDSADVYLINTCTVTNTADKKCLREIKSLRNKYPEKILVVCGCSAQNKQALYQNLNIDILIGNKDKSKIVDLINNYLNKKNKYVKFYNERN